MKTALLFFGFVFGGMVLAFFSVFGLMWIGPGYFNDGTPYLMALFGGVLGLFLYLYRQAPWVPYFCGAWIGGVLVPLAVFWAFQVDITQRLISFILTTLGILLGLGAARALRLRTR